MNRQSLSKSVRYVLPFLFWMAVGFNPGGNTMVNKGAAWTAVYGSLLQQNVDERGRVDYRTLHKMPGQLGRAVAGVAGMNPVEFEKRPERDRIASWINIYNLLTLKLIVDHYPIHASFLKSFLYPKNSIRQIPGAWDRITFQVMGQAMTLNHIEHEILRRMFQEPRIHMALVCAAKGCPPLRQEPYDGARLEAQLEDQARHFLENENKFRLDRRRNRVYLSPIFKWFGSDFVKVYSVGQGFEGYNEVERAVLNFIVSHIHPSDREYLLHNRVKIRYMDYDWTLNEQMKGMSR